MAAAAGGGRQSGCRWGMQSASGRGEAADARRTTAREALIEPQKVDRWCTVPQTYCSETAQGSRACQACHRDGPRRANAARPNRCPQEQQPARAWGYEVDVDVEGGPERQSCSKSWLADIRSNICDNKHFRVGQKPTVLIRLLGARTWGFWSCPKCWCCLCPPPTL